MPSGPECWTEADLPAAAVAVLGTTSSQRINTMVTDAVTRTLDGDLTEVRMSDGILQATLALRSFLFEAVYENPRATAEFEKASGILGGLWDKLKARPEPYLDRDHDGDRGPRGGGHGLPGGHDRSLRRWPCSRSFSCLAPGTSDRPSC